MHARNWAGIRGRKQLSLQLIDKRLYLCMFGGKRTDVDGGKTLLHTVWRDSSFN